MTVYGSFDLEDDDFFDDTFRNITDAELSNPQNIMVIAEDSSSSKSQGSHKNSCDNLPEKVNQPCEQSSEELSIVSNRGNACTDLNSKDLKEMQQDSPILKKNSEDINSRFTPGFTPKARKRKFPGPAGFFSDNNEDDLKLNNLESEKQKSETDDGIQITNSQYSTEDLLLPSWQTLQAEVSSKSTLQAAKYYSIRRVYYETSKKKLPKHIVVPLLCVLLKKLNQTESHSLFIDDTGEISGKIEKPVLCNFGEYLRDGVALILKKVTFLCNVLVLTEESIASIYFGDGTVKHFQEVDAVPLKEEPLKPMSCPCSHAAKVVKNHPTNSFCKPPVNNNCEHIPIPKMKNTFSGPQKNNHSPKLTPSLKSMPKKDETKAPVSVGSVTLGNVVSRNLSLKNQFGNHAPTALATPNSEKHLPSGSLQNDSATPVENDYFDGVSDFDEFDELLGNLDEKSFMDEF